VKIGVPRPIIVLLASVFSSLHVMLGLYTLDVPANPLPVIAAMGVYIAATALSLWPSRQGRMPEWMAALNLIACGVMTLLISPQLDPGRDGGLGYATWHIAAIGTLMVITSSRGRHAFAWGGMALLVAYTAVWAGPAFLVTGGVIGSVSWVAISHILSRSLRRAAAEAQGFADAERHATDWQAAQEAHWNERQLRLAHTDTMAAPMLRVIERSQGSLTEAERQECLYLEAAIRDEIRGRGLLNAAVREQVMRARRRGASVTLFDEGGLDSLAAPERERVLNRLAEAISSTDAERIVARTVAPDSRIAVTIVGLTPSAGSAARELGSSDLDDDEVDNVDLWLEIPRR
jgi:hypothetical protein